MDLRTVVESDQDKKAKHYGRAYQCMRCLHREDKVTIDVKRRIEGHITKYHLRLDECAHYCRLCFFRCWDRKTLDAHVKAYARHRKAAKEQNVEDRDEQFLVSNTNHYTLGAADYMILSKEQSLEHFRKKDSSVEKMQPPEAEEPFSPISGAIDSLLGFEPPVFGPEVSAILDTLPDLDAACMGQEEPLNLTVTIPGLQDENIMPQLLPQEKRAIDDTDEEQSTKRQRIEASPVRRVETVEAPRKAPTSPAPSSSCSSDSSTPSISAEKWEEVGMRMMGKITEVVEQNTRAVRCMGRTLEELTKAVEVLARSGKAIQEVMEESAKERKREAEERRRETEERRRETEEKRRRDTEEKRRREPEEKNGEKENRESERAKGLHEDGRNTRTEGESRNRGSGRDDYERRKFGSDNWGYNRRF